MLQVFFSSPPASKPNLKELREQQAIARAQLVRQNNGFIPESAYRQRRAFFVAKVRPNKTSYFSKMSRYQGRGSGSIEG